MASSGDEVNGLRRSRRNMGLPPDDHGNNVPLVRHRRKTIFPSSGDLSSLGTLTPPVELEESSDEMSDLVSTRDRSTRESRSFKSSSSRASTAKKLRRKLELAAAEKLAEIELAKLHIEEKLIRKKTELQLEDIDEFGDASQSDDSQNISDYEEASCKSQGTTPWDHRVGGYHEGEYGLGPKKPEARRPCGDQETRYGIGPKKPKARNSCGPKTSEERRSSFMNQSSDEPTTCQGGMAELATAITQAIQNAASPVDNAVLSRHKIGKERLPIFEGNPLEWPTFISQFHETTTECKYSNTENIIRLRNCLKGEARETVQALLISPENVPVIIDVLQTNFGRSRMIVKKIIAKAKAIPTLKEGNLEEMFKFANTVKNLVTTIRSLKCVSFLENPQLLDELLEKLPLIFKLQWTDYIGKMEDFSLLDFDGWLTLLIQKLNLIADSGNSDDKSKKKSEKSFAVREGAKIDSRPPRKCACCGETGHGVAFCSQFKQMKTEERWKFVLDKKICYCCLTPGHFSLNCTKKKPCGIEDCEDTHHFLLHKRKTPMERTWRTPLLKHLEENNHAIGGNTITSLLPYVPVVVSSGDKKIRTYALLDEGSTATLIDESLVKELGITGRVDPLSMHLVNEGQSNHQDSMRVSFLIKGDYEGSRSSAINGARTISNIGISGQSMEFTKLEKRLPYLEGLPIASYSQVKPLILIGQPDKLLTLARRYVHGRKNEPVAYKTWLGWVISGRLPANKGCDECSFHVLEKTQIDEELHQLVKNSFSTENFGVSAFTEKTRTKEDVKAMEIMEKTTKRRGNSYETGLLWRDENVTLPESYWNAFYRLRCQEKKMDKDPAFAAMYNEKIAEYVEKGYVKKVCKEELEKNYQRAWFLPHFGVYNPNKPGKIRLVFDAAAKSKGVSLNDGLLQGPDLLNPLPAVLMRFRRYHIGFSADITDMFHRVWIRKDDLPSQRFLWRGMDRKGKPDVYQMNVMLFGATCSPSSAMFVKNKTAEELQSKYPAAFTAILYQFYMDDYLDSKDSVEESAKQVRETIEVCRSGNFSLCKWMASSRKVLEEIPEELRAEGYKDINLTESELPVGRTLGLWWNPETDMFTFKTAFHGVHPDIISGKKQPTKREILRLVMSIFDPQGFIAHFIIKAKILLQEIWRLGLQWDEEVSGGVAKTWKEWTEELQRITDFQIPRCYSPQIPRANSIDLHIFCDSSEKAFAAVAYLRVEHEENVDTMLIASRTRVAPLKPMSIPRLELQAAVLASRLGKSVLENIHLDIGRTVYWSDSKTVLCWLKSEGKRFKQFVGHRIGEILETTDSSWWRWVSSADNVADDATRNDDPCDFSRSSRWIVGPQFLKQKESTWPVLNLGKLEQPFDDVLEVKKDFVGYLNTEKPIIEIEDYSTYEKLISVTGWVLRYIYNLKNIQIQEKYLHLYERKSAEMFWIRQIQKDTFKKELECLMRDHFVPKTSKIYKLSPFLDKNGIIRMKTRLQNLEASPDEKQPIILDGNHSFTRLLIEYYHRALAHGGRYIVANELRRKYWIIGLGSQVRSAVTSCRACRKRSVQPVMPEMGNIPEVRLASYCRPFTHCGVDCWGPMEVTVGRSRQKRYGMIFVCLTTHAIHLEVLHSLSSDSCVMGILRMKSRRGIPKQIISDNGGNFIGGNNELKYFYDMWKTENFASDMGKRGIDWKFLPAGAPHMGGSHERLIRSVKTSLKVLLKEASPKEELLLTILAEVENIVNSRPLTQVPVDPDSPVALTPNDLLIGPEKIGESLGVMNDIGFIFGDMKYLRRQWQIGQTFADQFWRRWRTEYLPTLARREKWNRPTDPLQVGDIVILVEINADRNQWPLGVVTDVFPGKDGVVRVADIRIVKNGGRSTFKIVRRPISRICILEKARDAENYVSTSGGRMFGNEELK